MFSENTRCAKCGKLVARIDTYKVKFEPILPKVTYSTYDSIAITKCYNICTACAHAMMNKMEEALRDYV